MKRHHPPTTIRTRLRLVFLSILALLLMGIFQPIMAAPSPSTYEVHLPVVKTPEVLDQATVGYATGADRTLIRWFCTSNCNTQYAIYRSAKGDREQLVATIGREADATAATKVLNTTDGRWPDLYQNLLDEYQEQAVVDIAGLYALLDQNPLVAQKLSNEYYPVALINGWGYLDTSITPGTTYQYRVVRTLDGATVGTVSLVAGQLTPLAAPKNVQALSLNPETSAITHPKTTDWGSIQADRRFNQSAYLRWDVSAPEATAYPAEWTIGYDIYRAPREQPEALQQVNGELSVQPIAAAVPDISDSDMVLEAAAADDYQLIDHFYADQTGAPGNYIYRVAPRDALGQVRQWPADGSQFSAGVPVTTYDFLPPLPPQNLQALANAAHTQVALSWTMPNPPADLAGFRIEHTLAFSNSVPVAECDDPAICWAEVATLGPDVLQWTDTNSLKEQARWYRIQAVDTSGNRSMYSMPVHATLHDIQPPGKPVLDSFPCAKTPGMPGADYCLDADGDDSVTRYLVACVFESGGPEIMLLERAAVNGNMASFIITELYQPPFPLTKVPCTVRAVDQMGNISEPSEPTLIDEWASEQPATLPAPMLNEITTTALDEDGNATAQVNWSMPDSPLIDSFRLTRERISNTGNTVVVINGLNPSARSFNDNGVRAGELYSYRVTAVLGFGRGELTSEPRFYRAVSNGRRPLVRFDLTNINWNANNGTSLAWNSCQPGAPFDGPFRYAVFRSVELAQGYTQITPIFPTTMCSATYTDNSAQHGRYFYTIMQFDLRTGEPIGYTIPVQFSGDYTPQPGPDVVLAPGQGLVQSTQYTPNLQLFLPNCTAINPAGNDFSQPLRFGDGYEVHDLNINLGANNALGGTGNLRVINAGAPVNIPVTFSGITLADAQNRVCGGALSVNLTTALGQPLAVTPASGLSYQVLELEVRPFFSNISNGSGKVRVILPRSLRALDANGDESDLLNIGGPQLQINANLEFSFQTNIDQIATHGCEAGQDPILAFSLETLPALVVPTGTLSVTPAGIEASGSCMDYAERYNPAAANGYARPAAGNLNAGDSNDGFLRGRYTGERNSTRITPAGLEGSFTSAVPMSYVASYPHGFNIELNGNKQLALANSQIAGGSLGSGSATFRYSRTISEVPTQQVTVIFNDLTVDARGGLYATVTPATAAVEWMLPNGFVTGLLNTELYLGQVTSDQQPGQVINGLATSALWATRPADAVDLGLEQPATLEPGLNLRRADHGLFWRSCPAGTMHSMAAVADSYIRHGGISERFQGQIATPFSTNIHGYRTEIDTFDISFLDNFSHDSDIRGNLALPFPANVDLRFISMWFGLDGCIGGGELLNGVENLAYWNVNATLNHAVFADEGPLPALPGYPHWDRVLRTIGALEVPHLALPGRDAPTLVGVGIGFRPDGNPYEAINLAPNRPDFEFDGFPLLLSGMRLSQLNEAATWDANATAATPPGTNWAERGFVEIQSAIAAPYFGLLVRESGAPGDYPEIRMQLHENYVGFDEQLKGARVWVDLPVVQVTHEFSRLVYASSALENQGLLVGFREYEFVPQAGIDLLGLPQSAKVVHMDAAVIMEPVHVHFFLGQSAGTAAFRAMAEAMGGQNPPPPSNNAMIAWANQLGMSAAASQGYRQLAPNVWATYSAFANPNFRITTQVLNEYDLQPGQGLPDSNEFGGGTLGAVESAGVDFNKMRGHVEVDGIGLGMQLEAFQVAFELIVQDNDEPQPIFSSHLVSLIISRYGDYIVEGANLQSSITGNELALDLTGVYNPNQQALEIGAGLHKDIDLLHDFEMWNISLNEATGAIGLGGENLRYIGLNLEASWNFVPFKAGAFGGQVLAGTIDPNSPVLQNHFPDVLEHLHLVPAAPGENAGATLLKGAYVRLYGDMTQGNRKIAKVLTVNGGARFGGWYWSDQAGGEYYGGLAGMFVHTNYLKVVSARGDITFTYEHTPAAEHVAAETWIAGGIGSCEPETWTTWASRWWNDRWCWSAGAQAELEYNLTDDDFDASWDFDLE